jgi:hypothetical protein
MTMNILEQSERHDDLTTEELASVAGEIFSIFYAAGAQALKDQEELERYLREECKIDPFAKLPCV